MENEPWETDTTFHAWYSSGSWAGRTFTDRKSVRVEILIINSYSNFGTIDEFLSTVQEARDSVPKEYRASSRVFGEHGYYDSEWGFKAYYVRPQTEEEWREEKRWSYSHFLKNEISHSFV